MPTSSISITDIKTRFGTLNRKVFQNSHKAVILRVCDFIGCTQKPTLKTKRLGAAKQRKNQ